MRQNFMSKRLIALALSASIFWAAGASIGFAQTAPDPARLAAARKLMDAAGLSAQFESVLPLITEQMEKAFLSLQPSHEAEIKEVFKLIPQKFSARKQEMLDQIAVLYAQKLTADELNTITDFYKSPVGAKLIKLQPEIVQESMSLGQAWGLNIGREIEQEVRNALKQRGVPM
jgi:hypothetical protein